MEEVVKVVLLVLGRQGKAITAAAARNRAVAVVERAARAATDLVLATLTPTQAASAALAKRLPSQALP